MLMSLSCCAVLCCAVLCRAVLLQIVAGSYFTGPSMNPAVVSLTGFTGDQSAARV